MSLTDRDLDAAKAIAKHAKASFLSKLGFGSDKNSGLTLPAHAHSNPAPSPNPNPRPTDDLVQSFDALALSGQSSSANPPTNPSQYNSDPGFIGGFYPGYTPAGPYEHDSNPLPSSAPRPNINSNSEGQLPAHLRPAFPVPGRTYTNSSPGPLPRPPTMPTPYSAAGNGQTQSLTMQHALRPDLNILTPGTPPSRPHSASMVPPPSFNLSSNPTPSASVSSSSAHLSIPGSPSAKPKRPRASSTPPTPTSSTASTADTDTTQCSGITKAGKRCTRQVKTGPALSGIMGPDSDTDATIERFCHQHSKEVLGPSGYYAKKGGQWVKFEDWIPDYLQPDTQVALRVEMEKSRSQSDVPGYIYTFEIRDPKSPKTIKLKVGRAVNLVKRIDQWGKQCGSKEQVLRGWYPGSIEDDDDTGGGSLMKGRVKAGAKGAWCHRLERLIHLELADLVVGEAYLDPAWPKVGAATSATGNGTGGTPKKGSSAGKKLADKDKPCPDCGAIHKEIFEFKRVEKGRYKGKEWESIVLPVIEKWGAFVEAYV